MKKILLLSMLVLVLLLVSRIVFAADANQELRTEGAGAEQARFELQEELRKQALQAQEEAKKKTEIEEVQPEVVPEEEGRAFKLNGIKLTGNDHIPSAVFEPLIQSYVGKEVYLKDLRELASGIKRTYREEGYIAAYVYIPPQTVSGGIVEIAVIEGILGQINVKGNHWFSQRVIKRFLRLVPGQVLFYDNLRSALSFLNKHRDIDAKAVLKPGVEPQTTDLEIDVKDKFPIHPGVDVNNLGTKNTGETRIGFSVADTNLFGQMDQLSSRFQFGAHTWAIGADYHIPVHPSGTLLGISYSRSSVKLAGDFKPLNVKGDAATYGFYALQPLIRKSWVEATLNLGFDWKSIKNKILGQKAGNDELRILNSGINLEFTDRWGKTYFPNSFHVGFDRFLGASHKDDPNATRPGSGGQFFIYRSSLIRYQRLPFGLMYAFRGQAQLTNNAVAPSEQLQLGGAMAVRGYPEGEYLADYGAYMTNELYIPTYFFPKKWKLPYSKESLRNQIQAVPFFDFGGGNLRKPLTGEKGERTLAGTGIGVRIHLYDKVYGRVQWATPISSKSSNGSKTAFYYGISAEFM